MGSSAPSGSNAISTLLLDAIEDPLPRADGLGASSKPMESPRGEKRRLARLFTCVWARMAAIAVGSPPPLPPSRCACTAYRDSVCSPLDDRRRTLARPDPPPPPPLLLCCWAADSAASDESSSWRPSTLMRLSRRKSAALETLSPRVLKRSPSS